MYQLPMNIRSAHLLVLLFAFAFGSLPALAQNPEKIKLRFMSFPKAVEPVKLELRLANDTTTAITAPSNEFSPPEVVDALGVWSVGETITTEEGEVVFKEYGRVNAPTSPEQMVLLIRKGETNSDGFELVALDGRVNQFGGGKFFFLNAAKVDIAGVVGEVQFALKPGQNTIIQPKPEDGNDLAHAIFYFRKEDEPRAFFSSRWPIGDHARSMVFFYHDPDTNQLRLHTIRDFM